MSDLLKRLAAASYTGLDGSPGDSLAGEAAQCIAELHNVRDAQIEYSIKLQRLIENLKYPDTDPPYPHLHHHKMIVAAKARIAALEAALRKLRNEVGALHAFEPEVRAAVGNTNWGCLMLRVRDADALLSTAETDVKRMPPREFDIESHQGLYTQTVTEPDPKCADASWVLENGIAVCENCRKPVDEIFADAASRHATPSAPKIGGKHGD